MSTASTDNDIELLERAQARVRNAVLGRLVTGVATRHADRALEAALQAYATSHGPLSMAAIIEARRGRLDELEDWFDRALLEAAEVEAHAVSLEQVRTMTACSGVPA